MMSGIFLTFIDYFSRKVWVFILISKDETFEEFKQWKVMVDNQTNRNLKCLRTNNGLEFCGEKFSNLCGNQGIVRHRTMKSMPQQNGLVKRINSIILERARCMLINARLLAKFWTEVVNTTCHLINKCLSSAINFKTPQEVWTSKPGSYQHLGVFRSTTYALENDGKLQPRTKKCLFLGYPIRVKGHLAMVFGFEESNNQ